MNSTHQDSSRNRSTYSAPTHTSKYSYHLMHDLFTRKQSNSCANRRPVAICYMPLETYNTSISIICSMHTTHPTTTQFSLIESLFNSLCLRSEHCCSYLDSSVRKLHVIDEIVIVKRNTEFVHLNPFIIEVNIVVKPTIFTVNTESNYCHFQLSINIPDLVGRATRNM